jgi:hypothetical protein
MGVCFSLNPDTDFNLNRGQPVHLVSGENKMSAKQIHIYTSSKGGVGKTLEALCTSLWFLKNGYNILICDFNLFNADLLQIMKNLVDTKSSPINQKGLVFRPLIFPESYIINPLELYALPGNGIIGFLDLIGTVFDFIDEKKITPEAIIVDTGFHFGNFGIENPTGQLEWPVTARQYVPYFWFTWTVAAMRREEELAALRKTMRILHQQPFGWGEFAETTNFLHVLNPHAIVPNFDWTAIKSFLKFGGNVSIVPGFEEISKFSKTRQGIPLNFMDSSLRKSLDDAFGGRAFEGQITRAEQFERVVAPFLEFKSRPKNLLVIPYYVKSLVTFTDMFSFRAGLSVKNIIDTLDPIYQVMDSFLTEL